MASSACPDSSGRWSTCHLPKCKPLSRCQLGDCYRAISGCALSFGYIFGRRTALQSRPEEELGLCGAWFCCHRVSCPVGCARSCHLCRESNEMGGQAMWDGATVVFPRGPLCPCCARGSISDLEEASLSTSLSSGKRSRKAEGYGSAWTQAPDSPGLWGRQQKDVFLPLGKV